MTSPSASVASLRMALSATARETFLPFHERFGFGRRTGLLAGAATLTIIALTVAVATPLTQPLAGVAIASGFLLLLLSLRWPWVSLFLLALLIPVEGALVIDESLGTLSRYVAILFVISYASPRLGRLSPIAMPLPAWGFLLWALLSVGWAVDREPAIGDVPVLILLFLTALCVASVVIDRPNIVRPLLWAYSLAAGATALLAIYTYVATGGSVGERVASLENQNPGYFAAILLPAFIFTLHEFLAGRKLALSAVASGICALGIVISGARGTWLSALIVMFVLLLPRLDPVRRVAAVAVILAAAIALLQVPTVSALVSDRAQDAISGGGAGRTDIWSVAGTIYESSPFLGVGLRNFQISFTPERVRDTDVAVDFYDPFVPGRASYRAPHNIVFQTLVELGPFGLALLVLFLGPLVLQRGWGPDGAVIQAALASLAINALFLDMLNRRQFWLLIGVACGLAYLARRAERTRSVLAQARTSLELAGRGP